MPMNGDRYGTTATRYTRKTGPGLAAIKFSRHIRRATLIGFTDALSVRCSRTIVKVSSAVTQARVCRWNIWDAGRKRFGLVIRLVILLVTRYFEVAIPNEEITTWKFRSANRQFTSGR